MGRWEVILEIFRDQHVCVLIHVWLFAILCTLAHQAPLSMGILQARILKWVALSSSKGSSQPRNGTLVSPALAGGFFTTVPPGKPTHWTGEGRPIKLERSLGRNNRGPGALETYTHPSHAGPLSESLIPCPHVNLPSYKSTEKRPLLSIYIFGSTGCYSFLSCQ